MVEARYTRRPEIVARSIGEETVLVPLKGSFVELQCLFTLNETGTFIWEELARPMTIEQLSRALSGEFEVGLHQAEEDVRELVRQLLQEGCIHDGCAANAEGGERSSPPESESAGRADPR